MNGMDATRALVVVRAGLHTTIQDGGRWGYQHLGVPVGGALDLPSLRRANALVGNHLDEAGLEITLAGGELQADGALHLAVTGARFDLWLNDAKAPVDTALALAPGDRLVFGQRRAGARAYVAVRGGIDVPPFLGSRSAWPLRPRRGALVDGCRLPVGLRHAGPMRAGTLPTPAPSGVVRVLAGPDLPTPDALAGICAGSYRIGAGASRMAYPLEGPAVSLPDPARASSGTVNGALQILPDGTPMLLMAERQTTGGYPVAAVVITADLAILAQLAPGDEVRFVGCTRQEAIRALWETEREWRPS